MGTALDKAWNALQRLVKDLSDGGEITIRNSNGKEEIIEIPTAAATRHPSESEESMNIFVGNLPFTAADQDLRRLFEEHGSVLSAKVILDKETGRSRGFGFIEMSRIEGEMAIDTAGELVLEGRNLTVNEARPRREMQRSDGGGGGGYRGGGSGGGGGYRGGGSGRDGGGW